MIDLKPSKSDPAVLHAAVGPLHVHAALLSERDDGTPDEAGEVEWYVTASESRGDWRFSLFEGYDDSLAEAKAKIAEGLRSLRDALALALGSG